VEAAATRARPSRKGLMMEVVTFFALLVVLGLLVTR
jgi:hypothetical protein